MSNIVRNIPLVLLKRNLERRFSHIENSLLRLLVAKTDAPIDDVISDLRDVQLMYLTLLKQLEKGHLKNQMNIVSDWSKYLNCVEDYILGVESGVHDSHMENEASGTRTNIYNKLKKLLGTTTK